MWIAQLLAIMGFSSTFPIYAYFIQSLGVEDHLVARWSGAVIAISSISMGILGPIWGALGDRHGRKVMVIRAMFGGALIIGLQGFSQNVWQFAFLRLIQGALTGTVTAATALVASKTPKERLGETLGKFQLAIFLGQAFGPTTGGFVADTFGYRATFWLTAVYLLVAGSLILFLVQEQHEPTAESLEGSLWQRMRQDFSVIFAGSLLGLVLALRFALRVGLRITSPTMPLIVQDLMPGSTLLGSASGLLTTVSGISSALAAPMMGRWADKGDSRLLLLGSALLAALALAIQAAAPTYWLLVAGQFLLGLGIGGTLSVISAYVGRMAPEGRIGTAFGLDALAVSLANAVGPAAGGWLSDTVSRRSPLVVGAVAMTLAALAVLRLPAGRAEATSRAALPGGRPAS